jgi:hypothetical protein
MTSRTDFYLVLFGLGLLAVTAFLLYEGLSSLGKGISNAGNSVGSVFSWPFRAGNALFDTLSAEIGGLFSVAKNPDDALQNPGSGFVGGGGSLSGPSGGAGGAW